MTKMPPHPLAVMFSALMRHAGYGESQPGKRTDQACEAPCCRFVQLMADEEPPVDVRPGRGAKRVRGARHYTKRIA